jgi:predicted TIM-barrel fold metal-dependent hydrolase
MRHPNMKNTWRKLAGLGLSVEMQSLPCYTPIVRALKSEFPDMVLQIDHFGQPARGTEAEFRQVLELARLPRVYMRVEPLGGGGAPGGRWYRDPDQIVRMVYDAFGPNHLLWSGFGGSMKAFDARMAALDQMFRFASEEDLTKIRGLNTMKLFGFPT